MADLQQTLGKVIRAERRRRKRTMKWLADRAALSLVYLGEIERGRKYPSAPVLERLAWALDLPLPTLLEQVAVGLRGGQSVTVDAIGVPFAPHADAAPQHAHIPMPRPLELRAA